MGGFCSGGFSEARHMQHYGAPQDEGVALLQAKLAWEQQQQQQQALMLRREEPRARCCSGPCGLFCMPCCCGVCLTVLIVLVWLLATAQVTVYGTTFTFFNYYLGLPSYLLAGRKDDVALVDWYRSLPMISEGVYEGPGPNTKSYYSWNEVHRQLSEWAPRIQMGTFKRHNELGVTFQNDLVWPGTKTVALGLPNEDHQYVRPFLGNALDKARNDANAECDGSTCWNKRWLRRFFHERLHAMDYVASSDMKWMITIVLHKVLLNIDLTDDEAKEFSLWMMEFIMPQPFPKPWINNRLGNWLLNVDGVLQFRNSLVQKYSQAIRAKWPEREFSSQEMELLASTMIDSLALAGGLSVPIALEFMVALIFMEDSPAGYVNLEELEAGGAKLHNFMLETLRRYAPVAGMPGWTTDDNGATWQHQIPNLQMAMLDPDVFPNPLAFQAGRPGLTLGDESRSMTWAEPAISNDDAADPDSHACPGKDLSVQIIAAFIQELACSGPWQVQDPKITLNLYGPSGWLLKHPNATSAEPGHPVPNEPICNAAGSICVWVCSADFR